MKLRFSIMDLKRDFHDGIQSFDFLRVVIVRRIEAQTVESRAKSVLAGKQLGATAVRVGPRGAQRHPVA